MKNRVLTIIGGVNGVGKSSYTGSIKNLIDDLGIIIDVNKIAKQSNCSNIVAGKIAIEKINDCLLKGISFTQETTLSGYRTQKTINQAIENGFYIRLYYIGVNELEESLIRIQNRVKKGGHNILQADVEKRYKSRFENVNRILPYCNQAFFIDNENGFDVVCEYKNDEMFLIRK